MNYSLQWATNRPGSGLTSPMIPVTALGLWSSVFCVFIPWLLLFMVLVVVMVFCSCLLFLASSFQSLCPPCVSYAVSHVSASVSLCMRHVLLWQSRVLLCSVLLPFVSICLITPSCVSCSSRYPAVYLSPQSPPVCCCFLHVAVCRFMFSSPVMSSH